MPLSDRIVNELLTAGFSQADITAVNGYAPLLNDLQTFEARGGHINKIDTAGAYASAGNIYFNPSFANLSILAHELRHVIGTHQAGPLSAYSSAEAYSRARVGGEGESLYYQYLADQQFHTNTLYLWAWEDNTLERVPKQFAPLIGAVIGGGATAVTYDALGKLNEIMIGSTDGGDPSMTYDETNKWDWLQFQTSIKADYLETGSSLADHRWQIKSLTNRADHLLGDSASNTITNKASGTVLGSVSGDLIYGDKGNDTLTGGDSLDVILGGADQDVLKGLGGADTLAGNSGNDSLDGGDGDDKLYGGSGMDTLDGGLGADTMSGGTEDDHYIVNNPGDVIIESLGTDSAVSYDSIESSVTYTAPDFVEAITLIGNANINATANSTGCDLTGNTGNNYLKGGDNLDFIFGDEGVDILEGGLGDDYYYLTGNEDTVIEKAGGGLDQIWAYGDGIKMADNVERLYMMSFLARSATGNGGNNLIQGNNRANTLYGDAGNDKLLSGSGDDTLYGGLGDDSLYGSTGNDVYHFTRGDGADMISDLDAADGNQDKLIFDGAVDSSQVWFSKSGSDLVLSIIGTGDKITIGSWYVGGLYQVESIVASGNGKTLSSAKVQNLVDAMASLTPPAQGQTTLPPSYQSSLNGVMASSWA